MSIRKPILDRRHRPRWQDELRTQQLIVGGFAVAIAVAIGIFGATMWSNYYDNHLRQVALVNGTSIDADDVSKRLNVIGAELSARGIDFNAQLGGALDSILQQQLQVVQEQLQQISTTATDSVVSAAFFDNLAPQYGLAVTDAEVDAEVARRQSLPLRLQLSAIVVDALPEDAPAAEEPTDEQMAAARAEAEGILADLQGGADFATTATEKSDDGATKATSGLVGWVTADNATYGRWFEQAKDAQADTLIGPFEDRESYVILRVDDRTEAGEFTILTQLLASSDVSDAEYREYIRQELLRDKARTYFETEVVQSYLPQREVAQIFISGDQGVPVPKQRLRHLLVQPIPGAEDQSTATEEQWEAALAEAEELYEEASKDDADWCELAQQSHDPGSRTRCGDLGWYDPSTSQFVAEFKAAVTGLAVGETTEPARTPFGYHVIQVTQSRISAEDQASQLVADLREDPDSFAEVATAQSEDATTARNGGVLGWVARYETAPEREAAIFALEEPGDISDPVSSGNGFYIFKLLNSSEARFVPESRRDTIRNIGFDRWVAEQKEGASIWVDGATDAASGGTSGTTTGAPQ
ncbi:MAG TPA: peptidylprolyl isomerase [Candidatus Limnocylindria bacterium]|nr:peptidylprolyl isomerase [Candidatus Limnocylindria bacterium]